ncbi:marvel domain-containing protein [Xylariales sp. AK1849]|nr:marvel domain-containing protein [Xylariales sp. AK1849]
MLSVIAIAVRAFLLLFGAVVLGLSITLAKQQVVGSPPSETSFSSFVGAFGIVVSAIGLLSLWLSKISPMITIVIDALASVFYLAGGIALTVALKGVSSCTSNDDYAVLTRFENKLLNGGCVTDNDGKVVGCFAGDDDRASLTIGRCQRVQADYVFEYLGFIFGIAIIALGWMVHKRGGNSSRAYV